MGATSLNERTSSCRGKQTPDNLVKAAETCFSEAGYSGASVASIRRAAGLSNGSVYHAFRGGKSDLAAVVYRRWSEAQRAEVCGITVDPRTSLESVLTKYLLPTYVSWFTRSHGRARFMLEVEALVPGKATRSAINEARSEMQDLLRNLLGRAHGAMQLNHLSPTIVDALVLGPIRVVIADWARLQKGAPDPAGLTAILGDAGAASLLNIARYRQRK